MYQPTSGCIARCIDIRFSHLFQYNRNDCYLTFITIPYFNPHKVLTPPVLVNPNHLKANQINILISEEWSIILLSHMVCNSRLDRYSSAAFLHFSEFSVAVHIDCLNVGQHTLLLVNTKLNISKPIHSNY